MFCHGGWWPYLSSLLFSGLSISHSVTPNQISLWKEEQTMLLLYFTDDACPVLFNSFQSLGCVRLFVTPWTAACQALCPSPTPGVYPNSCPLNQWCHPTISSSVVPFSSCLQSFPTSGSFQMSQLFASGGQNIGVSTSTSVLPMNTQDWFPLG